MADKLVEFHPKVGGELDAAAEWYRARSVSAPMLFLREVDRGVQMIAEVSRSAWHAKFPLASISLRPGLSRTLVFDSNRRSGAHPQATELLG